ncbi:MAG: porin [Alphaproteobacteria bacterium]|nr:porin [Alphaproteobacteria bacterium]MCL2889716.1 porin [Alphaproteobacteria bacterium]
MKKILLCLMPCALCFAAHANPLEYQYGDFTFRASGEGMIGGAYARDPDDYFLSDFRIRLTGNYAFDDEWRMGAVYSVDRLTLDADKWARDAFMFVESPWGRGEAGITDSIANKMGVALPDVGGLRINDYSIVYDIANPNAMFIANPTNGGTRYSLRGSIATVPSKPWQFGISFAPGEDRFKSASDIGIKYRKPDGKTKITASFGASFIDSPRNLTEDIFDYVADANFRAQIATGLNVQYTSWMFGLNVRAIYDHEPLGPTKDGLRIGTGASYDLLNYSVSASYIFSDVGLFHDNGTRYVHTGLLSLRYKINQFVDVWTSGGLVASEITTSPFIAGGLRGKF